MSWLDERTGINGLLKRLFHEEIPSSAGWRTDNG